MKEKYIVNNFYNFISLPTEDIKKPLYIDAGNLNSLEPRFKKLTLDEIRYINLMSDVFKTGRLEFLRDDEEELFEELGIEKEEGTFFYAEDVLDTVKHPTKEKLEKVVKINSLNTIDLFRGIVISFRNLGNEDVSNRVLTVVNKRRDEVYANPGKETTISIKKTSAEVEIETREKAMEEAMASALADMQAKLKKDYDKKLKKELDKIKKEAKKEEDSNK